jgi:protocatechuate 3,4-dioxygenase, alpha subunit
MTLRGRVLDGDGSVVPDGVLEIWRADETGLYSDASSTRSYDERGVPSGFARFPTNDLGEFAFQTIKPGTIRNAKGEIHAPHLVVLVFMRGLQKHLLTRMYFPDEAANENDTALAAVPAERRNTLIAVQSGGNQNELRWDIRLQGDAETVFFEA